jgi:hypothetical protein
METISEIKDLIKYCKEIGVSNIDIDIKNKTQTIGVKVSFGTVASGKEISKEEIIENVESSLKDLPDYVKQDIIRQREELDKANSVLLDPVKFMEQYMEGNINGVTTE